VAEVTLVSCSLGQSPQFLAAERGRPLRLPIEPIGAPFRVTEKSSRRETILKVSFRSPAIAFPERSDLRDVMPSMPGVQRCESV